MGRMLRRALAASPTRRVAAVLSILLLSLGTVACASGSNGATPPLVIVTLTPAPEGAVPVGGKPAAPPTNVAPAAATQAPQPTPAPSSVPTAGRWIDVDVTRYVVSLMEGPRVMKVIAPVGVGTQIDTGAYESTQTGLFYVYVKTPGLQYDPPYKTYISDWVGFDAAKANGFHSFLKDDLGKVVDPSTGRISNGCIRTGDSVAIYDFAEIGMPVLVHF